jgi:hypothetical protein
LNSGNQKNVCGERLCLEAAVIGQGTADFAAQKHRLAWDHDPQQSSRLVLKAGGATDTFDLLQAMLCALPSQEDGVHAIGVASVCSTVDPNGVSLAALIVASNAAAI